MSEDIKAPKDRHFRRQRQISAAISLTVYITCSQAALRQHNTTIGVVLVGLSGVAFFAELISAGLLITRIRDEFQRTYSHVPSSGRPSSP